MKEWDVAPSVFESFNARAQAPADVARTFVVSDAYRRLARTAHSILIGPRGSGKTTLLKMLEVASLRSWGAENAETYRRYVKFSGIFVPVDRSWTEQLREVRDLSANGELETAVQRAAISAHVMRSLVTAFMQRLASEPTAAARYRAVDGKRGSEEELVRRLAEAWSVRPRVLSLLGLQASLGERLAGVGVLVNRLRLERIDARAALLPTEDAFYLDPIHAVSLALDQFELVFPRHKDERWALLFDELELAPVWLVRQLKAATRSIDPRLLFKLAVSPFEGIERSSTATPWRPVAGQDFDEIALWYVDREQQMGFCRRLWAGLGPSANGIVRAPADILGHGSFETPKGDSETGGAYGASSGHAREFRELAQKDRTFRAYMRRHRLVANELASLPENKRASLVRKVGPLVLLRNFFLKLDEEGGEVRRRSRKVYPLFAGSETVFLMTEGNPRWFKGMIGELIDKARGKGGAYRRLSPEEQSDVVTGAANQMRALMAGLPLQEVLPGTEGILGVLDRIGDYFFAELVTRPFKANPSLTFTVEANAPRALVEAVGIALNVGAIVLAPQQRSKDTGRKAWVPQSIQTTRGNRFRLSYLLAAQYGIVLRLGEAASLGTILGTAGGGGGGSSGTQLALDGAGDDDD